MNDDSEQTITICCLTNHTVPVSELDIDADDETLQKQALKAAESSKRVQQDTMNAEDRARCIRKELAEDGEEQ